MHLWRSLILAVVVLTVAPVLAQDSVPRAELTSCWMELPEGVVEGENLDCGYLIVPEDRSSDTGPTIQLAFAILYARTDAAYPDPVVYLAGGPGGNAVGDLESWLDTPYVQDRDLILLDQRGTGYSEPTLNCPEAEEDEDNATQACHDRLVSEGINLQAYNSVENAADVADLRVVLGYDEWNLYGVSYGTRLALTIMRDQPEGVRSVVIDSVYPPEINSWEEYGQNTADEFSLLFESCAADAQCDDTYPDLEQTFYDTVDQLNADPVQYSSTDADTGDSIDRDMSGNDYIDRVFQLLYSTESIPYLPLVITEVAYGNYAALDDLESGAIIESGYRQSPDEEDVSDSEGMNLSVECQEEVAFLNEDEAIANVPDEPAPLYENSVNAIEETFSDCAIWNMEPADAIENQPVVSDIPTLVVSGEFDPITPAKWAQDAASYLPNSYYFLFPGGGHGVIDLNACSQGIMQDFLDDPTQEPDGSCIADMTEPEWVLDVE